MYKPYITVLVKVTLLTAKDTNNVQGELCSRNIQLLENTVKPSRSHQCLLLNELLDV